MVGGVTSKLKSNFILTDLFKSGVPLSDPENLSGTAKIVGSSGMISYRIRSGPIGHPRLDPRPGQRICAHHPLSDQVQTV
jgi:hypothetical protein